VENKTFNIADFKVKLSFQDSKKNGMWLLPSFAPFETTDTPDAEDGDYFFRLTIDDSLQPAEEKTLIRIFDTGNGDTAVYQLPNGGYQYTIRDVMNRDCCLLITNEHFTECQCALNGDWTMRSFGLNDALMLIFAFAGSYHKTMLIHASCIMLRQPHQLPSAPVHTHPLPVAFPFTAKSGTGKSTHSGLWMQAIEGCELLNDDNPIVRLMDDAPYIYGSPWSGKTPCYRNIRARLGAMTRIDRSLENNCERLSPSQAFASILPACSSMQWDPEVHSNLCNIIARIIETTPCYTMHCRPDEEAAQVCHQTIVR
jgi:hypothetical protein